MNFYIAHRLPGRLRLRYSRRGLSRKQAVLVETLVSLQEGIRSISVNPVSGSILIEYSGISEDEALSYIKALNSSYLENEELLENVEEPIVSESLTVSLGMLLAEFFIRRLLPIPVRRILALFSIMPRVKGGMRALKGGRPFCAETLDATALSLSYATGDLNTAGTIAMMLEMGEILEEYTRRKSYENLTRSFLNTKETVHVLKDGNETEISANLLQAGDTVILRIGSVIPADGTVVSGEASVNQASMTGEGLPVHKVSGDTVFASTVVEEGEIHVCVKACGRETRVSKIADMIDRSQSLKAASQIKSERTADKLVFYNFLLAGLTYAFTRNFAKAASTLLVDYSCAMKLSAPVCVLSAMKNCAEHGITVKGGKFLEDFARADTIVFDKTGTLTESQPSVKKIITFGGRPEKDVLKIAACLEEHFPHSLARAVVREAEKAIEDLSKSGCSQLYLSIGKELAGIIAIEDPVRSEAKEVVSELHKLGIKNIIMLTGDGPQTAGSIAEKTGIDRYHAQALPDTKADFIKELKAEGKKIVMIGDGINDSPALSEADVGIAMGQASSIAGETADILLPDDGLRALPILRRIATGLIKRINVNNKAIIGINSALIAGELAGSIPPATAALVHNGSTVAIGMSAMRSYEPSLAESI